MKGRIVKGVGGFYYVSDGRNVYMGKARGILKRNKEILYVGDIVDYELSEDDECIITGLIKRDNYLIRPPVSNLDMLVVVFAASHPEVNFPVVNKLIAACEMRNIDVAVCITKRDLQKEEIIAEYVDTYSAIYPTVAINGISGEGVSELYGIIKGKSVALGGPSGVGKSTLLNAIIGESVAETGSISDKTLRGKHTTRHVEIFELSDGTALYDTPGFTSLEIGEISQSDVQKLFPEIRSLSPMCKYSDCMHINEPECEVKRAVEDGVIPGSRYQSYVSITEEVKKWH